jgi:hypothetical protein
MHISPKYIVQKTVDYSKKKARTQINRQGINGMYNNDQISKVKKDTIFTNTKK